MEASAQEHIPTWEELIGEQILIELELEFVINFSEEIFDVISEGQLFENHGFELSPVIRRAIMRKEFLFKDVEAVREMIQTYNSIIKGLAPSELFFLKEHLYQAEMKIQAGLGHYTWQSLNIRDYCAKCQSVGICLLRFPKLNLLTNLNHSSYFQLRSF